MAVPSISELSLLKALWRQQPLSAREIHDAVEAELGWSYSSTRKTLERMLDKGMVRQSMRQSATRSIRWPRSPTISASA
jgi:BlaI family penicillinase repressor